MSNLDKLNRISGLPPEETIFLSKSSVMYYAAAFLGGICTSIATYLLIAIILFRWVAPPTTSFMLQRQFEAQQNNQSLEQQYDWQNWEAIAPEIKMAAITSEDQRFAKHWGIDFNSIQKAINEYERGEDLRGASTITQQVAKNLFLWPSQSYLRKGIEANIALFIELLWSKKRILEVYLNIVEFGDGIYGVQAAAERYFNTTAADLSAWQSAMMVTALPAPKRYNLANPSQYMLERRSWILRYMHLLGTQQYLDKLK
ncbi:monofunctional biosynthetic peptidoglycan transglycosylase [Fodinibius salinus]|uniref:Biosynthetic peptidoglycan transglycosylase n=1 Tax=Fodinibius salinus TaxID=860790 RepID=A0A5D3YIX6_9BACT|nr:monofunctional biosynthetic peptidoglycan transglycosylase [Fodinibius salinus]TYP93458.1 monofunctional biosynthetic peptidoglycan transglycosylase [Fodinibius salinus]